MLTYDFHEEVKNTIKDPDMSSWDRECMVRNSAARFDPVAELELLQAELNDDELRAEAEKRYEHTRSAEAQERLEELARRIEVLATWHDFVRVSNHVCTEENILVLRNQFQDFIQSILLYPDTKIANAALAAVREEEKGIPFGMDADVEGEIDESYFVIGSLRNVMRHRPLGWPKLEKLATYYAESPLCEEPLDGVVSVLQTLHDIALVLGYRHPLRDREYDPRPLLNPFEWKAFHLMNAITLNLCSTKPLPRGSRGLEYCAWHRHLVSSRNSQRELDEAAWEAACLATDVYLKAGPFEDVSIFQATLCKYALYKRYMEVEDGSLELWCDRCFKSYEGGFKCLSPFQQVDILQHAKNSTVREQAHWILGPDAQYLCLLLGIDMNQFSSGFRRFEEIKEFFKCEPGVNAPEFMALAFSTQNERMQENAIYVMENREDVLMDLASQTDDPERLAWIGRQLKNTRNICTLAKRIGTEFITKTQMEEGPFLQRELEKMQLCSQEADDDLEGSEQ